MSLADQAAGYTALLAGAAGSGSWLRGVFVWLWKDDPSGGGPSCDQFTPFGKPAELVLRQYFGATAPARAVVVPNTTQG